jgi:thymidylate kinase
MTCKPITVFEGPDGGGKSTAAKAFATATGARYVHCGPFPGVRSIGRLYLEAMAPALLGHQPVVLDRCWVSEAVYGLVHRDGEDRLGVAGRRMLERVAMRCGANVFLYLPPLDTCIGNYRRRKGEEYLDSETKLAKVWHQYKDRAAGDGIHRLTDLWTTVVDYTQLETAATAINPSSVRVGSFHEAAWSSAGNRDAKVLLVGEGFGPVKEADALAQYPFVSFSSTGCARWITQHLEDCKIPEQDLLWVNVLEPGAGDVLAAHPHLPRVVLGDRAYQELCVVDVGGDATVLRAEHPQHAKHFGFRKTYTLIRTLKELIHGNR